jgi:hypothetical protein
MQILSTEDPCGSVPQPVGSTEFWDMVFTVQESPMMESKLDAIVDYTLNKSPDYFCETLLLDAVIPESDILAENASIGENFAFEDNDYWE